MVRFLVVAPPLRGLEAKSGGIRVMYKLCELIQKSGHSSYMINHYKHLFGQEYEECDYMKSHNLEFFKDTITDEDIVIYIDSVQNNYLNAKNVVWYLLHRPMHVMGNPIDYGDDDLLITFQKVIDPHLDDLFILLDDRHLFYPPNDWNEKQNIACIYFWKGRTQLADSELSKFLTQFEQVIQITRTFPESKEDFAELLRASKLLICCDSLTGVSYESLLCGTPVYFVDDFFKICKLGMGMSYYGAFNSLNDYENAIEEVPLFQLEFEMAVQGNQHRVNKFVSLAVDYFENINIIKQKNPSIYKQFVNHKKSRKELDNYRYLRYISNNNSIYI